MGYVIDLKGQRFNQLVALEYITTNRWLFLCDCGNQKIITSPNVKSGSIVSCGCHRERNRVKHGLTNHPWYYIRNNMINRCYKKDSQDYCWYGYRGITVCDEWLNDFKVFYDWAMQSGYQSGLTLDRIDTDSNYNPDNCGWDPIEAITTSSLPVGFRRATANVL